MSQTNIQIRNAVKIRSVAKADVETALVAATQRTSAYRKASLIDEQYRLNDWVNGLILTVECTNDAEVAAEVTIWAYTEDGPAMLVGVIGTIVGGAQVSDDGYFWAESAAAPTDGDRVITEMDSAGYIGTWKFDTQGYKYIVAQVTAIGQASGTVNVWAKPW